MDEYPSLSGLLRNEDKKHYKLFTINRESDIVIIAPHGGGIEPGTSELAKQIAGTEYSFLLFEGVLNKNNKEILHVTSTNIDYPPWIVLLKKALISISIHGTREETLGSKGVEVGGMNKELISKINHYLTKRGFNVKHSPQNRNAKSPKNIVNRARRKGCQLELSKELRESFFGVSTRTRLEREQMFSEKKCSSQFYEFADAIIDSIENNGGSNAYIT